jgi:Ca-activated chloride channel family protein
LRADDRIAIVTYAGSSGVALPSTPARQRDVIQRAIASLGAGGSTNGGGGLILAYRIALESFIPGGINRVILATDGDFNVGIVNQRDLLHLIERQRESGVFLSVLGVGSGNLQDATMQMLADHGNGQYAYLDSLDEARRVLIREGESTLETVAKDVKFQVEFNPAVVRAWKQVGYEKRALAAQDFNDDRKDAGEMGAGHTVTVLYELIPVGVRGDEDTPATTSIDPLKYQTSNRPPAEMSAQAPSGEWATVKTRYKLPDEESSKLMTYVVRPGAQSGILSFAAAVAEFGLLLRNESADLRLWDALVGRVNNLDAPRNLSKEKTDFAELVAGARGIVKLRRQVH